MDRRPARPRPRRRPRVTSCIFGAACITDPDGIIHPGQARITVHRARAHQGCKQGFDARVEAIVAEIRAEPDLDDDQRTDQLAYMGEVGRAVAGLNFAVPGALEIDPAA